MPALLDRPVQLALVGPSGAAGNFASPRTRHILETIDRLAHAMCTSPHQSSTGGWSEFCLFLRSMGRDGIDTGGRFVVRAADKLGGGGSGHDGRR